MKTNYLEEVELIHPPQAGLLVPRVEHLRGAFSWSGASWLGKLLTLATLISALVLWLMALPSVDYRQMGDLGLWSILPLACYVALAVLATSFCLNVHLGQTPSWLLGLHVVIYLFLIHGTPPLIYETLRYSWAWKHLGIIDYIQRHGTVDPTIDVSAIYHNWPGFFALWAFWFDASGVKAGFQTGITVASWAPLYFNLLDFGALWLLYQTATNDRRLLWLAIWFFFLSNWVGQEYFSPQALGYFLHLVFLGIAFAWFRKPMVQPSFLLVKRPWLDRLLRLRGKLQSWAMYRELQPMASLPQQRVGLLILLVAIFVVIVTSHQLTPMMTILTMTLVVAMGRTTLRTLPWLMGLLFVTWVVYGATFFLRNELAHLTDSFGTLNRNIEANLIDLSRVSPAQRIVALAGRALTAGILLLGMRGSLYRIRHKQLDLSLLAIVLAPVLAMLANGYGGEILFRVYLFALPGLVFFVAALFYPRVDQGNHWLTVGAHLILSLCLLVGFQLAHFGKDHTYSFSHEEVAAAEYLYDTAPDGSLLIEGSRNYPREFRNYDTFTYIALNREPRAGQERFLQEPAKVFERWMRNPDYRASYLLLTRSQRQENRLVLSPMFITPDAPERIEACLRRSPHFQIVFENRDAVIFGLAGKAYPSPQAPPTNAHQPLRASNLLLLLLLLTLPGWGVIRLLQIPDPRVVWILSMAASITISLLLAQWMVFTRFWSPILAMRLLLAGSGLLIVGGWWLGRLRASKSQE